MNFDKLGDKFDMKYKMAWIAHDLTCMSDREINKLIPVIRNYNGQVMEKVFRRKKNRKYSKKCIPVNPKIKHKLNYCGKRKTIKNNM